MFSSTMTLSMPSAVSAASRCSTVSTDTASRVRPGLILDAAEVRDGRRNLEAAEIGPLETDAVVGRSRLQRQRDLVAGMKSDSGAGDGSAKGSLRVHDLSDGGWESHSELSKASCQLQTILQCDL